LGCLRQQSRAKRFTEAITDVLKAGLPAKEAKLSRKTKRAK
jgi:hypothetical protein